MNWWNITVFLAIPALSAAAMCRIKRRLLWTAPLISTALSFTVSAAAMPSILSDREHCSMFWDIAIPIQLAAAAAFALAAYLISRFWGKMKKR